ncbi:hypothetical protein BBF96_04450 [Anoxybacter fermentans]|uniref:VWFA domain-containing protein n=1 Tax=Anoxybacter fermentans TaxID=1323375 RepID=A0A3Q9HPE9_9FIRM|nr:VWA domain-containing protein [Anoxybacter fermentans]AZR72707.1 hypothetical protein BBF96_04450 [Anoxybacter fermentans]
MFDKKNLFLLTFLLILITVSAWLLPASYFKEVFFYGNKKLTVQDEIYLTFPKPEINVEVIVDVSGSMWGKFEGVSKIINSKGILKILLKDLPQDVKLGLRTFGGKEESRLEVPLGLNNREEIEKKVKKLRPDGKSPIGYALDQAGKDLLKIRGQKYIILISDGLDNGKIDPIAKAKELRDAGIITHVVFLKSAENVGEEKLLKIAEAGGGHFFTINEKDLVVPIMTLTN